jgi:hypothetical protein
MVLLLRVACAIAAVTRQPADRALPTLSDLTEAQVLEGGERSGAHDRPALLEILIGSSEESRCA